MGGVNQRYSWVDGGVLSEEIVTDPAQCLLVSKMFTNPAQIQNVREIRGVSYMTNLGWETGSGRS